MSDPTLPPDAEPLTGRARTLALEEVLVRGNDLRLRRRAILGAIVAAVLLVTAVPVVVGALGGDGADELVVGDNAAIPYTPDTDPPPPPIGSLGMPSPPLIDCDFMDCGTGSTGDPASGGNAEVTSSTSLSVTPTTASRPSSTLPKRSSTSMVPFPSIPSTTLPPGFARETRNEGPTGPGTAILDDVRVERHDGYDRIVFQFRTHTPEFRVHFVDPPVFYEGTSDLAHIPGEAFLRIWFGSASGIDPDTGTPTYQGADRVSGGTAALTQAARTRDDGGELTWVAGMSNQAPFRVTIAQGQHIIAVDILA